MHSDKKVLHILSIVSLCTLLLVFFLPLGNSGRIVAAVCLLPIAILLPLFIKKRSILSINKNQVLLILTVTALVVVMLYYLTGLKFGFYKNPYSLSVRNFLQYVLPIAAIIVSTEIIRYVLMAQNSKFAKIACYFICLIADLLIVSNIPAVTTFSRFMELIVGTLFPAILANLLYNYLSKRYGMYPNIAYRAITTLHVYTFSIRSGISDSLVNFANTLIPIAIFLFIDSLYEKKRKNALGNTSRVMRVVSGTLTVVVLILMTGTVMLVSNQFQYGSLVIATESMTGELNKGDVVIFESYDGHTVQEGQVIVFESNDSMIVHRVVEIEIINGVARYYTKGDANEDMDSGFILNSNIVGVATYKLPYMGYPTLWLRSLFKR